MGFVIGDKVKQNRVRNQNDIKFVGRESIIIDIFIDENGKTHVKTNDLIWCPADLLDKVYRHD